MKHETIIDIQRILLLESIRATVDQDKRGHPCFVVDWWWFLRVINLFQDGSPKDINPPHKNR